MHATTEQLLTLRDGQPVDVSVAAHVAGCAHCRRELRSLGRARQALRGLPELAPPHGLWAAVAAEALPAPGRPSWRRPGWPVFGSLAAGFVLGMALILNMTQRPEDLPRPGTTTDLVAATPAPASSVNGVSRAELMETSRRLEDSLRALPAAPQVTRASTVLTIQELQDSIFEVDLLLSEPGLDPARERALWQQRVGLMDTLMQVRYAQLTESW